MTEALQNSRDYTPHDLAALVEAARTGPKGDEARAAAEKKLIVLLRVPNYFEDAALIARKGRMDPDLKRLRHLGRFPAAPHRDHDLDIPVALDLTQLLKREYSDQQQPNRCDCRNPNRNVSVERYVMRAKQGSDHDPLVPGRGRWPKKTRLKRSVR
jgi:hypothetical protein